MNQSETNQSYKRFRERIASRLVGCESAVAFFLKKDTVDQASHDPDDKVNEIFYSLATNPEIYTIFRLAAMLTPNPEGDKLFEETVKKYKLDEAAKNK